jgi:hypothetical protein
MAENNALDLVALANELEAFIQSCVPDSAKVSKYGGTLFTLKPEEKEGQFCGVFVYSAHVQLSFSRGPQLKDERKLLTGTGKHRRHINFKNTEEIDYPYIKDLLLQASRM